MINERQYEGDGFGMKLKGITILLAMALFVLPGCGILDSAQQTVNFTTETTAYMQSLTSFGTEMTTLAEQALTDATARTDLKQQLVDLKEQVTSYAGITVPDYATEIHQSIVQYNETLQSGIDKALTNIEQGRAAFESTGIPESVNKINELLSQVNQLTPQ
ncbi:hypothetical protein I6N90_07425 [Paenibacillus sp. GSMTC-2017]|uniref:DUF6376 family protein n=1 Tax=Paenibacillus sp. GSMTC-2017 TaxID=2794350 RepID=UPI001A2FF984|nr:DUF6376 family protein [Paenibacillus sp. GSMTC-2017]MBH5317631.1 hypothetical protein [Paenibacillus sp. GSMTC-2017]